MTNDQHRTIEEYARAIHDIAEYAKVILPSYAKCSNAPRDIIIRNFLARSVTSLNGLVQLWRVQDYHDCWLLYRGILDRLFHLESLGREDSFEVFEKWCFLNRHRYKLKCLADPTLAGKINPSYFTPSDKDTQRFESIGHERVAWKRPRAKEVASEMGLDFLYSYGYDFASMYVHPSAIEGEEDYSRLLGIQPEESYDDQITAVHNACLVMIIMVRVALILSKLAWRSVVMQFVDHFSGFIAGGQSEHSVDLEKLREMTDMDLTLCQRGDR